eukprot:gene12774-7048_t
MSERKSWFQSEDVLAQDTVTNILSFFDLKESCSISRVCKLWRLSIFNIQTTFDINCLKTIYPLKDYMEKIKNFEFTNEEYEAKFKGKENSRLKYASIGSLIEMFMEPVETEKRFKEIFISSFQSFIEFETLALILIKSFKEFEIENKKSHMISIINCFDLLVKQHIYEELFLNNHSPSDFLKEIFYFIEECISSDDFSIKMKGHFTKISIAQQFNQLSKKKDDLIFRTKEISIKEDLISELTIEEMASQLTIIQYELFKKAKSSEFFRVIWRKNSKLTPVLSTLMDKFENISLWVANSIMKEDTVEKRSKKIKYFVHLGKALLDFRNFQTLFAIIAGLTSASVYRLKKSFALCGEEVIELIELFRNLISLRSNFSMLRGTMQSCENLSILPYLGMVLSDLKGISDSFELKESVKDVYKEKSITIINWKEMVLDFEIVQEVVNWQVKHFPKYAKYETEVMKVKQTCELMKIIEFEDIFNSYFDEMKTFKQLYDVSLLYEPRQ